MRTFTRPDDGGAGRAPITEEPYVCRFGVGRIALAGDLPLELCLPDPGARAPQGSRARSRWTLAVERYFAGERVGFDLDVDTYASAQGLTPFERDVYAALARVPHGSVVSYRELACLAGRPNAYRAVGSAMARNHLPVILACHRVIRNDGHLGEYGDDPSWKERLLTLEGVHVNEGKVA